MSQILILKVLTGLHVLFAGTFVGSNIFLDFLLTPRLDLLPPGQAARLGEKLGTDFAILNFATLGGSAATGFLMGWRLKMLGRMTGLHFYGTGYGAGLLVMIVLWLSLIVTGLILTFFLRPRVVVKLPFNSSREEVEGSRESAVKYAAWMRRLARYNAITAVILVLDGGFLVRGGLF